MVLDPPQNLYGEESNILSGSFGISSEVRSKMLLTHISKFWDEINTQLHPSFSSMTPPETNCLQLCYIILK